MGEETRVRGEVIETEPNHFRTSIEVTRMSSGNVISCKSIWARLQRRIRNCANILVLRVCVCVAEWTLSLTLPLLQHLQNLSRRTILSF